MLYLGILVVAVIGSTIGIHLIYTAGRVPAKLLGAYTLVIAITSTEPLGKFVPIELKPFQNGIIAVCSFMIGPLLFLYCKYRLVAHGWRIREYWHFAPAILIILIYPSTYYTKSSGPKSDPQEIVFYLVFVLQLLSYTFVSLFVVLKKTRTNNQTMHQKLQAAFLKPLVFVSMILFTYSFLHSLVPVFREDFILIIQVMMGILMIVIALLNDEKLQKHIEVK